MASVALVVWILAIYVVQTVSATISPTPTPSQTVSATTLRLSPTLTLSPTTQQPTTTTQTPTTQKPTTQTPTTQKPTTQKPTTQKPTTQKPTTQKPTTQKPTTQKPTTQKPTTQKPTTQKPTTQKPTTQKPTTQKPTTQKPTTQKPTTQKPKPVTCGFGVDFDDWLMQLVPTNVLRTFCYTKGLCHHVEKTKENAVWCKGIANQMKRLLKELEPSAKNIVFTRLQSVQHIDCNAVNISKLETLSNSQDQSLTKVLLRLTSRKVGCQHYCTNATGRLCYLASVLLENFADTKLKGATPNTSPTNRITQKTTDYTPSHATTNAITNVATAAGPNPSLGNSSSGITKMSAYIILLVAAMFASGLAYLAYINWGTVSTASHSL